MGVVAVVLAAGRGERLGQDKALMSLGGEPAIRAVVRRCRAAFGDAVVVVRRRGAAALPEMRARLVEVESEQMVDSLRAALAALAPQPPTGVIVFPIDHAMVGGATLAALGEELERGAGIALPLCRGRPGHPIALAWSVAREVDSAATVTLRDVIRRDPGRVRTVDVDDGWVLRDIDRPEDLMAANGALANLGSATGLMGRHRSRRVYRPEPVGDAQLRWIVDSARHASTSSFIQAGSAVAVRDPERRERIAALCDDQAHVRDAPVFVAVCADLSRVAAACRRHGTELASDSLEMFVAATVDAALFGQNLQLAAESEGLGACMIGAARAHPVELAALLGLPPQVWVVFGMTLGWPADDPLPRARLPLDAVLHMETYAADRTGPALDAADAAMRAWARASNARAPTGARPVDERRGWTDRMAWVCSGERATKGRAQLAAALRQLGFGLRDLEGRP